MLGLGSNITGISKVGTTIVTDNLVLRHDYKMRAVEPLSSGAASFDGTNDYIDCGDIGAAKSLAFWFKTSTNITSSSNYQRVFGFSSSYYGVNLGASTGSLSGEVLTVLTDHSSRTATTTTFDSNTWYHACISWNASSNYFDIYINGVLSTDLSTGTHTLADWDSFIIGTDNGSGTHFGGYICNVGVWNATLSQAQVKSIMNKNYDGLSSSEKTNLVSWWNLDETLGDKGIVLDKNGAIGENLLDNADFANGQDDWNGFGSGNLTLLNGVVIMDGTSGVAQLGQSILTNGSTYEVEFTITDHNGDTTNSEIIDNGGNSLFAIPSNGTYKIHFTLAYANANIVFRAKTGSKFSISNISVKLVNGNHGTLS